MAILLGILFAVHIGCNIAIKYATLGKRRSLEECFNILEKDGIYSRDEFEKLEKEEVKVKTSDGLVLRGIFIEKHENSKIVVIIVHGYNLAFPKSLCFIEMFFKENFNVLIVDQRGHGRCNHSCRS
jgi:hypothetical protein